MDNASDQYFLIAKDKKSFDEKMDLLISEYNLTSYSDQIKKLIFSYNEIDSISLSDNTTSPFILRPEEETYGLAEAAGVLVNDYYFGIRKALLFFIFEVLFLLIVCSGVADDQVEFYETVVLVILPFIMGKKEYLTKVSRLEYCVLFLLLKNYKWEMSFDIDAVNNLIPTGESCIHKEKARKWQCAHLSKDGKVCLLGKKGYRYDVGEILDMLERNNIIKYEEDKYNVEL